MVRRGRRVIGVLVLLASVLAGCGGSSGPPAPTGSLRVPVSVQEVDKTPFGANVRVMVHGRPYTFRVDSGAGRTFISSAVAGQIAPGPPGPNFTAETIGCSISGQTKTLSDWSLDGHPLPTETVGIQPLTGGGQMLDGAPLAGLLGADVLSGFGAMDLDFRHRTLTLGGGLRAGTDNSASLTVLRRNGGVAAVTSVSIRGKAAKWVIDTGASTSFTARSDPQIATIAFDTVQPITVHSPTCTSQVGLLHPAPWSAGSIKLPDIPIPSGPSHVDPDVPGLLGDDIIANFGSVTIDFAHQRVSYGD